MEREIRHRLQKLSVGQLRLLVDTTADVRSAVAWLAAVKLSAFLFDFAADCLRAKLLTHDTILRASDYERFVEEMTPSHPELTGLTTSTAGKIRRVLVLMLKEAKLLEPGPDLGHIRRPVLPPDLRDQILLDDSRWLAAFLIPDEEIAAAGGSL